MGEAVVTPLILNAMFELQTNLVYNYSGFVQNVVIFLDAKLANEPAKLRDP